MNGKRILILGGGGFIGYHLAAALSADAENQIVLFDNFVRGQRDNDLESLLGRPNISLVTGDVADRSALDAAGGGFDHVYHLAAIIGVRHVLARPEETLRVNILGTWNVLDWLLAGGGKKLVLASTSEVYAWTQSFHALPIPTPEGVPLALTDLANPRSTYAGSKIIGELMATQLCRGRDRPFAIVRYHNVYGPRMGFDHVIPELYKRVMEGQSPLVVYSAHHRRAFCYVDDAVAATMLVMNMAEANGETFHIGNSDAEVSIGDLARRIQAWAGKPGPLQEAEAGNDPISRRCPDISRARARLGYRPVFDLAQGLDRTLAWYAERLRDETDSADGSRT